MITCAICREKKHLDHYPDKKSQWKVCYQCDLNLFRKRLVRSKQLYKALKEKYRHTVESLRQTIGKFKAQESQGWNDIELRRLILASQLEFESEGDFEQFVGRPYKAALAKMKVLGILGIVHGNERIWTDDKLCEMWYRKTREGLSFQQIAELWGHPNPSAGRHALIGAWHRYVRHRESFYADRWSPTPEAQVFRLRPRKEAGLAWKTSHKLFLNSRAGRRNNP